ncbi:MAG: patatin-like phospholipase family protein [Gammaproteobacteria bacterium]
MSTPRLLIGGILLLCCGLWSSTAIAAACDTDQDRPSVGLALSGGGARGAAHVGVLKVLEELSIPVDCIAGTSMGAIVGGLYAGGMSAAELEQVIGSVDWSDAFRDDPQRDQLSFRRKQDDYDFLADFELGLRDGAVKLPLGVVQGQKLGLLLRRLNTPVGAIASFDRLPIPFRAVATDAVSGSTVVLGSGDLTRAQRASMAAPGVFAPVVLDGRLLIDGGISNNLPINVARAMGADIVIAVDISFPLLPRESLDSAITLSNQALTILVRREAARQLGLLTPRDVAIVPPLGTYSSADFSSLSVAIETGYKAASKQREQLAALSIDATQHAAWLAQRAAQRATPPPRIRNIELQDDSRLSRATLASNLRLKVGDVYDPALLEQDIARLYGLNIFEVVDYEVAGEEQIDIKITTREKSWGPNFLNFGMSLADDFERAGRYAVGMRYTRTQVNPMGGEWRIDLQFGSQPRLTTEFYQPLGRGSRFFVAPRINLEKFDGEFFDDIGNLLGQYRVSTQDYGVDLGYTFNERSEVRLGLIYGSGRARRIIGDPTLPQFDVDGGRARFLYRYDSLDDTAFPTSGQRMSATFQSLRDALGADIDRERTAVEWIGVKTLRDTHFLAGLSVSSNLSGNGGIEDLFSLGGLFQLSGYRTNSLNGQHAALATLSGYRGVSFNNRLPFPLYVGASIETGNTWQDTRDVDFDSLRFGGSLFVGLDTPIGPAYLAYGIAENGNTATYFFLGQRFGSQIN